MLSTSLLYGAWLEGFSKERERGGCNDSRFSRACLMALIYIEYSANFFILTVWVASVRCLAVWDHWKGRSDFWERSGGRSVVSPFCKNKIWSRNVC